MVTLLAIADVFRDRFSATKLPFLTSLAVALGTCGVGATLEANRDHGMRPLESPDH